MKKKFLPTQDLEGTQATRFLPAEQSTIENKANMRPKNLAVEKFKAEKL